MDFKLSKYGYGILVSYSLSMAIYMAYGSPRFHILNVACPLKSVKAPILSDYEGLWATFDEFWAILSSFVRFWAVLCDFQPVDMDTFCNCWVHLLNMGLRLSKYGHIYGIWLPSLSMGEIYGIFYGGLKGASIWPLRETLQNACCDVY